MAGTRAAGERFVGVPVLNHSCRRPAGTRIVPLVFVGAAWLLLLWPRELTPDHLLTAFPMQLIWAAIWEEALFRGWLQPALRDRLGARPVVLGLTSSNLLTSAAFAAVHLLGHPSALAPGYFGLSLVLGLCRERTGSVLAPILLHGIFNVAWWRFG